MPKITSLQPQKNNQDRFSIFLDGEYAFSLSTNDLLASGLATGDELSSDRVEELTGSSRLSKYFDKAINFISFRPRSRKEVEDYLKRSGLEMDDTLQLTDRLESSGYINDKSFAEAWVKDRQHLKPTSRRKLQQELRQKGINADILSNQLAEVDEDAERQALKELIAKKSRLASYQDRTRLTRYLLSQGFDFHLIKQELEGD